MSYFGRRENEDEKQFQLNLILKSTFLFQKKSRNYQMLLVTKFHHFYHKIPSSYTAYLTSFHFLCRNDQQAVDAVLLYVYARRDVIYNQYKLLPLSLCPCPCDWVCVCVCVCVSVSLCMCVYVWECGWVCVFQYVCVFGLSVFSCVSLFVTVSLSVSVNRCVIPCVYHCKCVCVFVCLYVSVCVCLCLCLSA